MTTLPQMTTLRMPRPLAAQQPMMIPAGPVAGPAAFKMTGADIWRVIRANLWLIIIMLVAMSGLGYAANKYLENNYPRYTATGLVQVQPNISYDPLKAVSTIIDVQSLPIELKTQAQLLRQDGLVSEVLRKSDKLRETEWFKEFGGNVELAKKDLRDNFSVAPIADTKLIMVSMTYRVPKDCRTIVDEIVNEHLTQQRKVNQDRQSARSQVLNNMRDTVGTRLKDIARELRETAIKLNIDGMNMPGRASAKDLELADLVRRQLELQSITAEAKAKFDAMSAMIQKGDVPPKVEEYINRDAKVLMYQQQLDQIEIALSGAVGSLGSENARLGSLQKARDVYQQKLQDVKSEMRSNATLMMLGELRDEASQSQQALEAINKRVDAVKEDLGALNNLMTQYMARRDEERQLLKQQDEVDVQLDQIVQMSNQTDLAPVAWMTRPDVPGTMSFPKLPFTMTVAVFLGLVLSLGIAFLREAMDTSVRSPRDVARVGQLNLLGMVPDEQDDPQAAGGRLPLVIFDAPNSVLAEQFRQVRTRLQMAASLDTTRSLMVTSPSPGDGKSTVACNIAAGLALNGRKILLVDANFRRPDIHKIFGIGNDVGFSDVLASVERLPEAAQETPIPNLSVMGTGPKPANPTELLESQLLNDFIEAALKEYDHVIFDSGPLLFVSDSVALAPRVDGVITVVRARINSRGLLQRMRDTLKQVKAEHLGVVLNAVRAQGGGYYGRNIKTFYAYQNGNAA